MKLFFLSLLSTTLCISHLIAQNNSLLFDGVDDKVVVLGNSSIFNSDSLTIEAWINASQWKSQQWQGTIVGKDQGNQSGFVLRCGNNGRLSFTVGTGTSWPEVVSTPIMQTNVWHHVAAVLSNDSMFIYIDGNLEGINPNGAIAHSTVNLHIGESSGFAGRVFDGRIDEVRIWNTARTQSEIQANDTVGLPNNTPGLVGYYKFNQVSGTLAPNTIPLATTDGTLINFTGNPWVPGFEPTTTDLSTSAIVSPDQITFFDGVSKVRARFKNNGIDTITSFTAGYALNSQSPISVTINDTLLPGESMTYTFYDWISSNDSLNTLKVFANVLGDVNHLNDTVTANFAKPSPSNQLEIPIFTAKQHNFAAAGQSHLATVPLPDDNTGYSQILMTISLDCPSTGCDPWDQPAKISLIKDGEVYEIARFITPYGKGCGPWVVDVTDFKTLLRGSCDFSSYIQVWGPSGWLLNASLTFVKGNSTNPYQRLSHLWATDHWIYGDTAKASYDLPARTIAIESATKASDFRITISGHGQGNTSNAAEFSNFTHTVVANGANFSSHNLWKNDCASNTCANQFGTWQFSRAGWCPGQEVQPHIVDVTSTASPGQNLVMDYVLQNYTNNLNTGYNGSSHTEPHYKIHAYLIQKSDEYIDSLELINLASQRITFPIDANNLSGSNPVKVMLKNHGSTTIVDPDLRLVINGSLIAQESLSATILAGDSLEYTFTALPGFVAGITYDISAIADATGDQAASDDVANLRLEPLLGTPRNKPSPKLIVYPNPSNGRFKVSVSNISGIESAEIVDLNGRTIFQKSFDKKESEFHIDARISPGSYVLRINTLEEAYNQSIIISQ